MFRKLFNKKFIHISDTDLDGIMCTVLTNYYFKNIKTLNIPIQNLYNEIINHIKTGVIREGDTILLTDLSLSEENKKILINNYSLDIYTIDHHITCSQDEKTILNINQSATKNYFEAIKSNSSMHVIAQTFHRDIHNINSLFTGNKNEMYMTFNPDVNGYIELFVNIVNSSDIFDKSDNILFNAGRTLNNIIHYKELENKPELLFTILNTYISINSMFTYKYIFLGIQELLDIAIQLGKRLTFYKLLTDRYFTPGDKLKSLIELEIDYKVNHIINNKLYLITEFRNNKTLLLEPNESISDIANKILNNEPKFKDIDIVISLTKNNVITLRSRDNGVNVAELAAKYGGGGHKCAAGIPIKIEYKDLQQFDTELQNINLISY